MQINDIRRTIGHSTAILLTIMSQTLYAADIGAVRSSRIKQLQQDFVKHPERGSELVTLILEDRSSIGLEKAIAATRVEIQRRKNKHYQVQLHVNSIEIFLDKLPQSVVARLPFPHSHTSVISQGVSITGANDMQNLMFDGSGIKIGVIDLGFASLTTSQAAGELPVNLTITDYTGTGTGGTNHGTNVAEIVHDMAPGAELYLAKISSSLELDAAVNDMINAGVTVINHSVGWYGTAFYDGTGPLCDITNTANDSGIVWVNSAGNARLQHYLGAMNDNDIDLRHEFTTGQNFNTLSTISGRTYTFVMNWDAYPKTSVDYDLFIYQGNPDSGGTLVASSTNPQSAKGAFQFPTPYEAVTFTAASSETHYIVVTKKDSSTTNLPFTLFTLSGSLGIRTLSSSMTQPADCASVFTVGATNLTDTAESFSSEGPTTDGRNKPEASAPNRVTTSLSSSFIGTSVSSPHAAGAAALLLQQNPAFTSTQVRDRLISLSHDVNSAGLDFRTGYGRISLDADNDTVNHDDDNCTLVYNLNQLDTDMDTLGDACDDDDDNDGLTDSFENTIGTNSLLIDTDGDTISDYDEVAYDGNSASYNSTADLNPLSKDTDGDGLADNTDPIPINFNYADGDLAPVGAPDGVINGADYLVAVRIVMGGIASNILELSHGDVYPVSAPDGIINVSDLILIQSMVQ